MRQYLLIEPEFRGDGKPLTVAIKDVQDVWLTHEPAEDGRPERFLLQVLRVDGEVISVASFQRDESWRATMTLSDLSRLLHDDSVRLFRVSNYGLESETFENYDAMRLALEAVDIQSAPAQEADHASA